MFPGFFMPWPLLAGAFLCVRPCNARSGRVPCRGPSWSVPLHKTDKSQQAASCEAVFPILAKSFSAAKRHREKSSQIQLKNELKND